MKHVDFVHLHVHTQFSLLDGTIRLEELFRTAKEYQMPAVALTDHGNLFGTINFYQTAYKYGIKPIIGCELYVAPGSRFDKSGHGAGETARHLIVLVKNIQGYRNLMKLSTAAYLEGFYYRPRIDKELLTEYSDGLIALSACLHGEIPSLLLRGEHEKAVSTAEQYRDLFGEDNFFLEIMENGIPEQKKVNEGLIEISRRLSLPLVATNDCHYLKRDDAEAHEVLLCIQTGKTLDAADRMRFATDQFYFRSPEEMKQLFAHCPQAIENTVRIAERCNLTLEFGKFYLPKFEAASDKTLDEHLKEAAENGLLRLLPSISKGFSNITEIRIRYEKRLQEELAIIRSMGFAGYFLIVADFVNYAKQRQIPVGPGRGSAAGSLVAYALGITNIDPIRYGLFFERFLNPSRISMPDIDIDFCQEGRDEIIRYVTDKYGTDHVAQIITFGKMQAKAVVRDVGRAMNIPYGEVDAIAKMIPNVLNISLGDAIKSETRLSEEEKKNPRIKKLLDLSRSLEGLNRHASTHAAGVVISDVPLVERVPLCSPKDDIVTQFSMNDIQSVGLTKFDFLGLKTLTVIKNALRLILEGRGVSLNMDELPLDDRKAYELLMRGDTDGVFQLESSGMKDILVNMKPDCIEDIIALIALYRPGPMNMVPEFISRKQGKTKIVYELPELESILKETYGVILYQEQVMQIAVVIGNYTMSEADTLRKVMSKKKASDMEKEKPKFLQGAEKRKIPGAKAKRIWEQMETFAEYGFNKSHSTAYAMISYQTAYLKAHYPSEFMAALLTSEKDNRDKIIKHINNCREMDIEVLPPDVNQSLSDFSVSSDKTIRFGLAAVKNIGVSAIEEIIHVRTKDGPFQSFQEFCQRVDLRKVNKRVVESMIKCGAFDSLGHKRRQLFDSYEKTMEMAQKHQRDRSSGQMSMFDRIDGREGEGNGSLDFADAIPPDISEWDHKELLGYEKETLGFYITGHPLLPYKEKLLSLSSTDTVSLAGKRDKENVTIAGIVSNIREITTKRKDVMAYVTLDDLNGSVTAIFFAEIYRNAFALLHSDEPVLIRGIMDIAEESVKVIANEIFLLSEATVIPYNSVHFRVDAKRTNEENLKHLYAIFREKQGKQDAYIHLMNGSSETVIYLGREMRLELSSELKQSADKILGTGATSFS